MTEEDIDKKFKKHSFNSKLLLKEMNSRGISLKPIAKTHLVRAQLNNHAEMLYDIYSNTISYTKGKYRITKFIFLKQSKDECSVKIFKLNFCFC